MDIDITWSEVAPDKQFVLLGITPSHAEKIIGADEPVELLEPENSTSADKVLSILCLVDFSLRLDLSRFECLATGLYGLLLKRRRSE